MMGGNERASSKNSEMLLSVRISFSKDVLLL